MKTANEMRKAKTSRTKAFNKYSKLVDMIEVQEKSLNRFMDIVGKRSQADTNKMRKILNSLPALEDDKKIAHTEWKKLDLSIKRFLKLA